MSGKREIELKAGESILVRCAACGTEATAAASSADTGSATPVASAAKKNKREEVNDNNGSTARTLAFGGKRKTRKAGKASKKQEGAAKTKAKKGPNGFMRFSKEMRGKLAAEDAALKSDVVAMSRRIGEMWRGLSDSEKKRYSE